MIYTNAFSACFPFTTSFPKNRKNPTSETGKPRRKCKKKQIRLSIMIKKNQINIYAVPQIIISAYFLDVPCHAFKSS